MISMTLADRAGSDVNMIGKNDAEKIDLSRLDPLAKCLFRPEMWGKIR